MNNFGLAVGIVVYNYDFRNLKLEAHPVKCYNGDKTDNFCNCGYDGEMSNTIRPKSLTPVQF